MGTNIQPIKPTSHYRTPNAAEQALLDEIEAHANDLRMLTQRVVQHANAVVESADTPYSQIAHPTRWAALAMTDLQNGVMKLRRAVMAPPIF